MSHKRLETLPANSDEMEAYLLRPARPFPLADRPLPEDFVLPHYELCIANIPATLARALGADLPGAAPPLPAPMWTDLAGDVRRVVWLILDSLGWLHLRQLLNAGELPALRALADHNNRLLPITSIFPSTTTAALTTFWTGHAAAGHGLVGHELYLSEYGVVVDTLGFNPAGEPRRGQMKKRGLKPEAFVPVPGLAEELARQGITTRLLLSYRLATSDLSRLWFRGVAEVSGTVTAVDTWACLRETLATHTDEHLLLVGYLDEIDAISHLRSPGSASWRAELRHLLASFEREFLRELSPAERKGTLLVITSDHGQVPLDGNSTVNVFDHSELRNHLLLYPTGGPRAAYLFARQGQVEAVRAYFHRHLEDAFFVVDPDAALDGGLLGPTPTSPEARGRLGDLIVLGRSHHILDYRRREFPLRGTHGGLSALEMLVPLLLARLD